MELQEHLKPHAVLIPLPHQGHINPFTHLAMKLASKGFTITFVNTESTHQKIARAQSLKDDDNPFSHGQNSGLDIRYAKINDGFPLSFDRSTKEFFEGLIHVFPAHVDDFIENLVLSKPNPPISCIIADSFSVWTSTIATKYNLVNVSFWTEPATVLTILYHVDLLRSNGHFGCHDKCEDTIRYIPGVQAIEPADLPSYCQDDDPITVVHRFVFKCLEDARKADFVICNTVQEVESSTISVLQDKQPLYAIGPVFPTRFTERIISTSLLQESDYTHWLNSKKDGTVLYISFGSLANMSKQDILEIAQGILISKVSFIWVLRHNLTSSGERNVLPLGFEEETVDRGLVVPWCSQLAVLSHPAVGGFLTHCGWNSILESMWCKVPMVCFPLLTDQFTNRKLVVDDWRTGVNLCSGRLVRRELVAENIGKIMTKSDELRKNIEETKMILQNALSEEGSSQKNLNKFMEDIKNKILQKI